MKKNVIFMLFLLVTFFSIACEKEDKDINPYLDLTKEVVLNICGAEDTYLGLDALGKDFSKKYPNCTITIESLQNIDKSLLTRLENNKDVDIFLSNKIENTSQYVDYVYDFKTKNNYLDLKDTHEGLVNNFVVLDDNKEEHLYSIPMGAEVRGLIVNKTLLNKYNLEVPKNLEELMNVCKVMKENNKIPFLANPGSFAQQLVYPYICNLIANASDKEKAYNTVNTASEDTLNYLREPLKVVYDLVSNDYYNYVKAREYFNDADVDKNNTYKAMTFLNILKNDAGEYEKVDGEGSVAFMTITLSLMYEFDKQSKAKGTNIEYEFIPAPVSSSGGFAYMSPSSGLSVNKNSNNIDWALEFLDFVFSRKNNEKLAEINNGIPNTKDAFDVLKKNFNISSDRISHVGQVTFDYNFYKVVNDSVLTLIAKGNNLDESKGYMDFSDPNNPKQFPFEYYIDIMKKQLASRREQLG